MQQRLLQTWGLFRARSRGAAVILLGKTARLAVQSTIYRNISETKELVLATGDSPSFRLPKIGSKNLGRPAAAVNGAAGVFVDASSIAS